MKKIILPLMGGIGNQLFQLAALSSLRKEAQIVIDPTIFSSSQSHEENGLRRLPLSSELELHDNNRIAWLSRRVAGLLVRLANWKNKAGLRKLMFKVLLKNAEIVFSFRYYGAVKVVVSSNVGYENINLPAKYKQVVLLGYFQSYKYHDSRESLRNSFELNNWGFDEIQHSRIQLSRTTKPLIVHVRKGDYIDNPKLGILAKDYYLDAIPKILEISKADSIWLFTNDPTIGFSYIPDHLISITQMMNFNLLSDLETLEMMKMGHSYLVANSTFSWWAAYLSFAKPENIFIPEPWYAQQSDPSHMSPKEWIRIRSPFEKN